MAAPIFKENTSLPRMWDSPSVRFELCLLLNGPTTLFAPVPQNVDIFGVTVLAGIKLKWDHLSAPESIWLVFSWKGGMWIQRHACWKIDQETYSSHHMPIWEAWNWTFPHSEGSNLADTSTSAFSLQSDAMKCYCWSNHPILVIFTAALGTQCIPEDSHFNRIGQNYTPGPLVAREVGEFCTWEVDSG